MSEITQLMIITLQPLYPIPKIHMSKRKRKKKMGNENGENERMRPDTQTPSHLLTPDNKPATRTILQPCPTYLGR